MPESAALTTASVELILAGAGVSSDGSGSRTFTIAQSPFLIGRGAENGNHLPIDDLRVSRRCAAIVREDDGFRIDDLGQLLGIYVNGAKITQQRLSDGDTITIGGESGHQLIFRTHAAGSAFERVIQEVEQVPTAQFQRPAEGLNKINLLLEASLLLNSQRPLELVLGAMLDHAIAITRADRGMLLVPEVSGTLAVQLAHNSKGEPLPAENMKPSRTVIAQAIEQQSAVINADVNLANLTVQSAHSVVYQLLRSTVVIPLYAMPRGGADDPAGPFARNLLGAVYLDSKHTAAFSALDRQILDALGAQAASILDNANLVARERERQRLEQELSIAREIQMALLPRGLDSYPHLAITSVHRPCHEVGGDYFDIFSIDDDRTAILIADVSGKGLGAALLTTMLQGALSGMTLGVDPARVIQQMNRFLCEHGNLGRYATMFFAVLGRDGQLDYIRAGHPSPMLLRDGTVTELYKGGSFPVGLVDEANFASVSVQLEAGDTLVLYSDGVTEAEDISGNLFGFDRLGKTLAIDAAATVERVQQNVLDAIETFAAGASQSDDITMLTVRYLG
ncbi:SpoIIE family protein phosphatase [Acidicapsa dinghuensis]|uniref:SpoIIE family protein phosphatase n=1 Tax=Acidicapsa dinghuensis TaxID=2218256 RepID=A0ABW1EGN4_9BACT|nr:SpoIIE family protein phosphatase [Acidicapsa dinghuensis]